MKIPINVVLFKNDLLTSRISALINSNNFLARITEIERVNDFKEDFSGPEYNFIISKRQNLPDQINLKALSSGAENKKTFIISIIDDRFFPDKDCPEVCDACLHTDELNDLAPRMHRMIDDISAPPVHRDDRELLNRLKTLLDVQGTRNCIIDSDGFVQFVNRAWAHCSDDAVLKGPEQGENLFDDLGNILGVPRPLDQEVLNRIRFFILSPSEPFIYQYSPEFGSTDRTYQISVLHFGIFSADYYIISHEEVGETGLVRKLHEQTDQVLSTVLENSGTAMCMIRPDFLIHRVNREFEELSGFSRIEIEGRKSWTDFIAGNDTPKIKALWDKPGSNDSPGSTTCEFRFRSMTGSDQNIKAVLQILPGTDFAIASLVSPPRDQTGINNAEEQLVEKENLWRTLVNTLPDLVWLKDLDGFFLGCNREFENFFGVEEKDIVGKSDFDFVEKNLAELFRTKDREVLRKGTVSVNAEEVVYTSEGRKVTMDTIKAPLYDKQNKMVGVLGIARNISRRKELEEQLHQSQKLEAIGQLAGGIAHDFNNLLTVINGYSSVLLDVLDTKDPNYKAVEQISNAGDKAASLTQQLLAFSRKQIIQPKILNLNQVVHTTEKILRRLIGEDVQLKTELAIDLDCIKADAGQMDQVIMNLAVNSRDAMPYGGTLGIGTKNIMVDSGSRVTNLSLKPGPYVELSISDNGAGMNEYTRNHLFEPFFTTKEQGRGTGLGLSTVYGIVKQHGGEILVRSAPNKGTTFRIYFPALKSDAEVHDENKSREKKISGTETILLIEDDAPVLKMTSEILRSAGFKVLMANNGKNALKSVRKYEHKIDLLITDVIIPDVNGKKMSEKIKKIIPDIKVVFISGYTDDALSRSGVIGENIRFLHKPFGPAALLHIVRDTLDSK